MERGFYEVIGGEGSLFGGKCSQSSWPAAARTTDDRPCLPPNGHVAIGFSSRVRGQALTSAARTKEIGGSHPGRGRRAGL